MPANVLTLKIASSFRGLRSRNPESFAITSRFPDAQLRI